jgi:hypothetical protein
MTIATNKLAKFVAVFVALYLLASCLLLLTLEPVTQWQLRSCLAVNPTTTSFLCDVSRPALAYWWLALMPVLLILTYLICRAWWRTRHDKAA